MKLWFFRTPVNGYYYTAQFAPDEAQRADCDRACSPTWAQFRGWKKPRECPRPLKPGECVPVTLRAEG